MRTFFGAALLLAALLFTWSATAQDQDPTQRDFGAYKIRVDDHVEILIPDFEEYSGKSVIVPGNGEVSFAPVGKIMLLDKTVFEVEERIKALLKDVEISTGEPRVWVSVTKYAERRAFLIGAVRGVVSLPVHKNIRVLELLALAGNLGNSDADFSRVTVRRRGRDGKAFQFRINVRDILDRGREDQNIVVYEDDMIVVPSLQAKNPESADWVYVLGKVGSPGRHPVIRGRTPFTLTKLVAIVGDFLEFGDRNNVTIIRQTSTGRQFIKIDFDDIIEGNRPDFELQADDLVYVPETWI